MPRVARWALAVGLISLGLTAGSCEPGCVAGHDTCNPGVHESADLVERLSADAGTAVWINFELLHEDRDATEGDVAGWLRTALPFLSDADREAVGREVDDLDVEALASATQEQGEGVSVALAVDHDVDALQSTLEHSGWAVTERDGVMVVGRSAHDVDAALEEPSNPGLGALAHAGLLEAPVQAVTTDLPAGGCVTGVLVADTLDIDGEVLATFDPPAPKVLVADGDPVARGELGDEAHVDDVATAARQLDVLWHGASDPSPVEALLGGQFTNDLSWLVTCP